MRQSAKINFENSHINTESFSNVSDLGFLQN